MRKHPLDLLVSCCFYGIVPSDLGYRLATGGPVATHVKVLAVLYIIFGVCGLLLAFGMLAVFGIAGLAAASTSEPDAWVALPVLGITGSALAFVLIVLSLPGIIAGAGLLKFKPWARIVTIVISALNLMNFPFGTIIGIYGLWVMLSDEGARLFNPSQPAVM